MKNCFYVRILGKKRLRTVGCAITYRCNAECPMCSAKLLMGNRKNKAAKELSTDEILALWKEAVKLGAVHINLTGGEPTLRNPDEIVTIIKGIVREGAFISMVTNGVSLLREDLARYAEAGLDTLQLSMESLDEKTHDTARNLPGNHKKIMRAFRWAKELRLNICLSVVLTAENFSEVKRIIEFAKQQKVFALLNPISSSGAKAGNADNSIADKKKEYYQLLKLGRVRADTMLNFRGAIGCPAGVERLYITPYAEVMTCPHVQISYGNIRKEPLKRIYKRISNFPFLKNFERDCRHVFNKDYIERMMQPIYGIPDLPVSIYRHPVAKEKEIRRYLEKA